MVTNASVLSITRLPRGMCQRYIYTYIYLVSILFYLKLSSSSDKVRNDGFNIPGFNNHGFNVPGFITLGFIIHGFSTSGFNINMDKNPYRALSWNKIDVSRSNGTGKYGAEVFKL
jgi:hypothetical protein